MQQAAVLDCLSFDPFSLHEDCLAAPEVDVGRGQVSDALVVPEVVVVGDEVADPLLEITGQVVVLEQDAVLERLMSALDLEAAFADDRARRAHGSCACRRARLASSSLTYELPLSLSSRGRCATVT